jgi:hypothetical protein
MLLRQCEMAYEDKYNMGHQIFISFLSDSCQLYMYICGLAVTFTCFCTYDRVSGMTKLFVGI